MQSLDYARPRKNFRSRYDGRGTGIVSLVAGSVVLSLAIAIWVLNWRANRLAAGRDITFWRPGDLLIMILTMLAVPFAIGSLATALAALWADRGRNLHAALAVAADIG